MCTFITVLLTALQFKDNKFNKNKTWQMSSNERLHYIAVLHWTLMPIFFLFTLVLGFSKTAQKRGWDGSGSRFLSISFLPKRLDKMQNQNQIPQNALRGDWGQLFAKVWNVWWKSKYLQTVLFIFTVPFSSSLHSPYNLNFNQLVNALVACCILNWETSRAQ